MGNRFWNGLLWGGMLGTVLGAVMGPMFKPQRKPLLERGADMVMSTTRGLVKEARRARRRVMKTME